jgi:ankyrin repeat protein
MSNGTGLKRTLLHEAAMGNDAASARSLIENGADPNAPDRDGFTPLHFAAQNYCVEVARVLLENGADANQRNKYGNTPLWTAVFESRGRGGVIGLLISSGANPDAVNNAGRSPRQLAETIGNYDVAQLMPPRS